MASDSELLVAADPESNPTATTISSLARDELLEIFLRLPDLPALARAAFTCRTWFGAVRSSPPFRRRFRALHPAPLIGFFLDTYGAPTPSFFPVRPLDPDVTPAVRRGDFFLTSLPAPASLRWNVADCCDGYILLWDTTEVALAALNPITWAVHSLPMPPADDIRAGADSAEDIWADADNAHDSWADADNLGGFTFLGFHILSSDDNPRSFRVVCICSDEYRVRTVVFSSETWDWVIHPWVEGTTMRASDGMMAAGSIYWPCPSYGTGSMIKIDTATMDITTLDMPNGVDMGAGSIKVGETKDGELCIAHDLMISFSMFGSIVLTGWARHYDGDLEVVQVKNGCVYLSAKLMCPLGALCRWVFSLSLETMKLELLVEGRYSDILKLVVRIAGANVFYL
ncbi:hypothetical protein CFC21_014210 [Triticum aestivum]|uniref:F-box domain-containing protein n=2 Tax=Triticum aestivum TaxID=4565 RepID=A0A9R1DUD3_WHEAT|nr:hypothetical protein CFC21_014210 [Triticum aestivum]